MLFRSGRRCCWIVGNGFQPPGIARVAGRLTNQPITSPRWQASRVYVGLTGGIGSGKSTLARLLGDCGAHVIDADAVAREVVDDVAHRIAAELDPALAPGGVVDRGALAQRIFGDPSARAWVESVVHPEVAARVARARAQLPPGAVVVYDVALLAEKGMAEQFDVVIAVAAPIDVRLARQIGRAHV